MRVFDCIRDQIAEHLLDQRRVGMNTAPARLDLELQALVLGKLANSLRSSAKISATVKLLTSGLIAPDSSLLMSAARSGDGTSR